MNAEMIDAMLEAGATADVIAAAWKADIAAQERLLEERRMRDRERQRRHRLSHNVTVTNGDSADPPKDINQTPLNPVSPDGETPLPSKTDEVAKAVAEWNAMADRTGLPKVRGKLGGSRLQRLRRRLVEYGFDGVREAIAAVERSPFCRGETGDWKADIGFLSRPDNFAKLIEGGFDRQRQSRPQTGGSFLDHFTEELARESRRAATG